MTIKPGVDTWTLKRTHLFDVCTMGELLRDGVFVCWTLEDPYRGDDMTNKIYSKTAIPCGIYRVVMSRSQRFNRLMPLLLDVPGFTGIRLHGGNTHADTLGCPLVAHQRSLTQRRIWSTAEKTVTGLFLCDCASGDVNLEVIIDKQN